MTQRRAGQRLRNQARARRHELIRLLWKQLLAATIAWLALGVVSALFIGLFYGRLGAAFVMGVYAGAYASLGFFMFREIDREGRRIGAGLEGEESTARELRRLRRHGWRVVHNLQFAYGDVDHIAVGPGGVAVIESKAGNADWQWHVDHGIPGQWLGQVRKNGQRVQAFIKQLSGHDVVVQMFVATWIQDQPDVPEMLTPTVSQLPGGQLARCLRESKVVLDKREIRTITKKLDQQAREWDANHGVRHPSTIRRLLGLG